MSLNSAMASRAVFAVLFCLFVGLTGFSVMVTRHTRLDLRALENAVTLSQAYRDASEGLTDAEAFTLRRQMTGAGTAAEFEQHVEKVRNALARVALAGDAEDRAAVEEMARAARPALASVREFLESGGNLDTSAANAQVIAQLKSAVRAPALERAAQAQVTIDDVSRDLRFDLVAAFGVFTVGALAITGLLVLLRYLGQRSLATTVELDRLRRAVLEDALTSLGNQRAFEEDLTRALGIATGTGEVLSLVLVDVDDFKVTNDTWGHERGDQVLRAVSRTLSAQAPPGAKAYRVGGDEFAVILPGTPLEAAHAIAERIRIAVVDAAACTISAGVSEASMAPADATLLREQADAALYDAKGRGRNLVRRYHPVADVLPLFPAAKIEGFRALIATDEIAFAFQPIWELESGTLLACEVLARPDARFGLTPAEAFQIAERVGRAPELDRLCIRSLLKRAEALPAEGLLFVNISPSTLVHAEFAAEEFATRFAEAGIPAERLVVEITERTTLPVGLIASYLDPLRASGVRVALDDVGSGNAGLEFLRNVRVDFVKVDRSVVFAAQSDRAARAVLTGILAFAGESGSRVIAEGIDDRTMLDFLQRISSPDAPRVIPGVDAVQGFLLGVPSATPSLQTPFPLAAPAEVA